MSDAEYCAKQKELMAKQEAQAHTETVAPTPAPIDVTIIASLETCAQRIETAKTPFVKSDREAIAAELREVIAKLS